SRPNASMPDCISRLLEQSGFTIPTAARYPWSVCARFLANPPVAAWLNLQARMRAPKGPRAHTISPPLLNRRLMVTVYHNRARSQNGFGSALEKRGELSLEGAAQRDLGTRLLRPTQPQNQGGQQPEGQDACDLP